MCVVEHYNQDVYVPWLICMDTNGDPEQQCATETGVDHSAMQTCVVDENPGLINKYLALDADIRGTPTVTVNGVNSRTSYFFIKRAICKGDPTLAGCSSNAYESREEAEYQERPASVAV